MTTEFSINQWFNNLPIRIIGSPEEPFFYAADLAAVLGIKNIRSSLINASEKDIVSAEQRRKYNITTYKKYGTGMRVDPTMILLTERGAYGFIYRSKAQVAGPLQDFIADLIHKARMASKTSLGSIDPNDTKQLRRVTNELDTYKTKIATLFLFKMRIDGDPYNFIPENEIDKYARDMSNKYGPPETVKNLYKLTDRATPLDHATFKLYAKIYDSTKEALHSLPSDDMVSITEEAHKHIVYFTRKPPIEDLEGVSIEYC